MSESERRIGRAEAAKIAEQALRAENVPGSVRQVRTLSEVHASKVREPLIYGLEIAEDDWIVYWKVDHRPMTVIGPSEIVVVSASGELRYLGSARDEG